VSTSSSEDEIADAVSCIAFKGKRRIASGSVRDVALKVKKWMDTPDHEAILVFNDRTSELIEIDFRGTSADVAKRLEATPVETPEKRGPGRPRLGVVGREVTLLPRHWDWLDSQPGGASVALRKLVEIAKRENLEKDRARASQQAAHRFMYAMAGNSPDFEEASRAFYSGDQKRFTSLTESWPRGIREHSRKLVERAMQDEIAARGKG
jgi:uncharacterized protein